MNLFCDNIICDVDLCIVRTDVVWLEYLKTKHNELYTPPDDLPLVLKGEVEYDLSKYFPGIGDRAYNFWSQGDLYDDLDPVKNSVEALNNLSEAGYNILFASYCKKGHFGSKCDWLYKHYSFLDGFFATKEKHFIKGCVFIDDRNDMLNRRYETDPDCLLIRFGTDYTQSEELIKEEKVFTSRDWVEINDYIIKTRNFKSMAETFNPKWTFRKDK